MSFSSLCSWSLAQHSPMSWLPWQQGMSCLQSLISKSTTDDCLKHNISLVKISWDIFWIFSKSPRKPSTFLSVATHQNDDDVMKPNWRGSHQTFSQFVKISTNSMSPPSFIVIWLEIAKLEGGRPLSLFRFAKSPIWIGFHCFTDCVFPSKHMWLF